MNAIESWKLRINLFIVAVSVTLLVGCVTAKRDISKIHYGLTKPEIIELIGKPFENRYIIENEAMVKATLRQCDLAEARDCKLREVKIGDRIIECQWTAGEYVLVVKFLNSDKKPALIWIVDSDI